MRHVNRHTILGHVGNLVELKNVLKVNIAANREWQADGEKKTATDWVQVTILDKKQVEWITQNVVSGDLVLDRKGFFKSANMQIFYVVAGHKKTGAHGAPALF